LVNPVFVSFEPLIFLFWVFLSAFLPGALLSFSIFKKDDFLWVEKLLIGFAIGMILLPLIPFILYLFLGIKFSYAIALLSVGVLYLVAGVMFFKNKTYEGLKLPAMPKMQSGDLSISKEAAISALLLLVLILSFLVRVGSYSPIFQELDPYYYTYIPQQILVFGENPVDDQTAWYPEQVVDHRVMPALSYLEALWYSLYTMGGEYSNMLMALVASMYPPIAAVLALFFIYLFVSVATKRQGGLVSAGVASFVPIFILKLSAGEQEVQPYAFFALTFFFAMYALSLIRKDHRFTLLAGLGFAAVSLGSASQILAMLSVVLFLAVHSIALFLRDKDEQGLRYLAIMNGIIFVIGPLFGSAILRDLFRSGSPSLNIVVPFFIITVFTTLLYLMKQRIPDRQNQYLALGAILLVGLIAFAVTPVGDYIKNSGKSAFGIAEFRFPLQRTIAEQNLAPKALGSTMGFMAEKYTTVAGVLLTPVTMVLDIFSEDASKVLVETFGWLFETLLAIFSVLVNISLTIFVAIVNAVLGTDVNFVEKENSLLLFWVFAFWVAVAWSFYRFVKGEDNLSILMLTFIMPAFVVGIIKAKFTIYSAVLLAMAIGFTLGEAHKAVGRFLKDEEAKSKAFKAIMIIAVLAVFLQFAHKGFAPSLAWGSMIPLYQNNPDALAPRFQEYCDQTSDPDLCAAAADPVGYADRGTNYQYNYKLCLLSVFSDISYVSKSSLAPPWESHVAYFRCQRISSYWIDSMEWIRDNTENGSRTTSWWDYGHWINYFGQKNAVLRNEHRSKEMIGAVADGYLDATPAELKSWMEAHDSRYALFDMELVFSGSTLGGKYGALNYLSCAHNNETTVARKPGESQCEADHLWEISYISSQGCTISTLSNKTGVVGYKVYITDSYTPYYPSSCVNPQTTEELVFCRDYVKMVPAYCVGEVMLASGETIIGTYYMNETYPNGDLKLNKALLQMPFQYSTSHVGPVTGVTLFYTHDNVWFENGAIKSGYEDRKGKFYDSNLYTALFLDYLPGFELAYTAPGGRVKIYEIAD
jgi:asparagine N-glycosylation enzyme membrane subunit Stt3